MPSFSRRRVAASGLFLSLAALFVVPRLTFDRQAWLEDYDQLRAHTARVYANLDWAIEHRGIDPHALHIRTRQALEAASTDREARAALASFAEAFHDGHFRLKRVKLSKRIEAWWAGLGSGSSPEASSPLTRDTPAEEACAALGFSDDLSPGTVAFDSVAGYTPLVSDAAGVDPWVSTAFPAGILAAGDRRAGILRIPIFDQNRYLAACLATWEAFRNSIDGTCDEGCQDDFVYQAVPDRILAGLEARIRGLASAGATAIVVDLTRNGGGTDWVDPAARLFAPAPLQCARSAFIRHPHHVENLKAMIADVDADLEAGGWTDLERQYLESAKGRLSGLMLEASTPCDRSGIWDRPDAKPGCSQLVQRELWACGIFPDLPAGILERARSRSLLFEGLRYRYHAGLWTGRLAILIDEGTGSAAEGFASMLKDGGGATLIGGQTSGSGCGYINGGVPARLEHSGLEFQMPDCVRYRKDGTNELEGLIPDIPIAWSDESAGARAGQVADALRRMK